VRRVVVDTSTLVSAALRVGSIPQQALSGILGTAVLCASIQTLDELEQVLRQEKFDRYQDSESRLAFVALIRRHVHIFEIGEAEIQFVDPPCRDPKDRVFLALALVAEADLILSSEADLLVLDPWRGIAIVTPGEFLSNS
jgi:putative PIN family toxin of toxin-antitoxin system